MSRLVKTLGVLGGIAGACFAWGLVEATRFRIKRVNLPILPGLGASIRVLHISDVHLMSSQRSKLRFLRTLADLEPDLVVNTGDNIAEASAILPFQASWGRLCQVPGVFVFGSNDYYAPTFKNPLQYVTHGPSSYDDQPRTALPWRELRDAMTSTGAWHDINQARTRLQIKGYTLDFRGTDDAHLNLDDYAEVAGPPAPDADLTIGVTHAPYARILNGMTTDGVDLIMAGHTHGGQVCVPGYGALVTNCDLDRKRVQGLSSHEFEGKTSALHVSGGLGTSPLAPYRFACPPSVTLLTLTSRN